MKLDVLELYQQRVKEFSQDILKYRHAFANDGLLFTITVLFILGGIYYRQMIELIPEQVPVPLLLAIGLACVVTLGKHRTFLKEADVLFLPQIEQSMEHYFQKALRYNLLVHCGGVLVLLLMLRPLYEAKVPLEHQSIWFYFLIPLLLKGWNLYSSWNILRLSDPRKRNIHKLARFAFNFILLFWFLTGATFMLGHTYVVGGIVLALGVVGFYVYERKVCQTYAYPWLLLQEMEKRLVIRFYSFINMFVDVPHIPKKVLQRKWLAWITNTLPFEKKQAYLFLLLKTFLRTEEYSSRYLRLSIVGVLLIWWIPNLYVKLAIAAGFVFITRSQLKGMRNYHQRQFWQSVFPWPPALLQRAYFNLAFTLMAVQGVFFILTILASL